MNRTADYTIKGFLYQFNVTLLRVLESENNEEIMVEGIIEDIDVISGDMINAIQCKYHETKGKYNLSDIYKPILQMMVHYSKNKDKDIRYTLYAYFSEEDNRSISLSIDDLNFIYTTNNKDYICKYISEILPPKDENIKSIVSKVMNTKNDKELVMQYYETCGNELELAFELDEFRKRFTLELGDSFEGISEKVKDKLKECDLSEDDIQDLFYPNAVQEIADLSIIHQEEKRIIKKVDFLRNIKLKKTTAITRWTLELKSYKQLMDKRRNQIFPKIKNNNKIINFILDAEMIEAFDEELINFIYDYNKKYNHKIELHEIPMFCLDGLRSIGIDIDGLEERLYKKNIPYENGKRGNQFFKEAFIREPRKQSTASRDGGWREFSIRFSEYDEKIEDAINTSKPDVLFIVSEKIYKNLDTQDIDIERLTVRNFNDLRYLLKITNEIE